MPPREITIPRVSGSPFILTIQPGSSTVIIGANGAGKTRLGVYLERQFAHDKVQRLAAQKSLNFEDHLSLISYERAEKGLRFGNPDAEFHTRDHIRWRGRPATHMLDDFNFLLQTLFAEQNRVAVRHLYESHEDSSTSRPVPKIGKLKEIWDRLLPHRQLELNEGSVSVSAPGQTPYSASEMSDGERVIFYHLGQSLLAPQDGTIIVDEPENHVHRAIQSRLWDAIEAARPDCTLIYITHDLDFATERTAAAKYFVRDFKPPQQWEIEALPTEIQLPAQVIAEIVGSRKPILFVEGERNSLDLCIYRSHYAAFTVIPMGSCEHVIHSVGVYRASEALHRLGNAYGIIDADDRTGEEISYLQTKSVFVLPVAEIENILLLPPVFLALADAFQCSDPARRLRELRVSVMRVAADNLETVGARHTVRRIDRSLRHLDVEAKDTQAIEAKFKREIALIDPRAISAGLQQKLRECVSADDLEGVLKLYDNKGMISLASKYLGISHPRELLEKVTRLLGNTDGTNLRATLAGILPTIPNP
jgi:energy-coupling factor transporter ATP-binding protein EcfA2